MSRIYIFVSRDWTHIRLGTLTRALPLLLVLAVLITAGAPSQAQSNFTVIHTFTGPDGAYPHSTPTLDSHGNLYGTTYHGGPMGRGLVYELAHINGSWILHPLHNFTGQSDGADPRAGVTFGPDGALFGTTQDSDVPHVYGTLFNVRRPANSVCMVALCPWIETTLHSFAGPEGADSMAGVVFDSQGNLYGTTHDGGTYSYGTVYKATLSEGAWNVSVLYSFHPVIGGNDGYEPLAGVVLDSAGNLYGTTSQGGAYGWGTVFELSPSEGGWTETILHSFTERGACPEGGLAFDRAGNLYGGTTGDYPSPGTIFELSPQSGGWNFTTISTVDGTYSALAIDAAGNLYGTAPGGTYGHGNVFMMSPSAGGWTYTDLYDFTGGNDGYEASGGVAVTGPGGYLYGTATRGGTYDLGVIYQINLGAQ